MLFVACIGLSNLAYAANPLTDQIVSVFKSDTSTIKYSIVLVADSMTIEQKMNSKNIKYEYTLVKNGTNKVSIADTYNMGNLMMSSVLMYKDGNSYSFGSVGNKLAYNADGYVKPAGSIIQFTGDGQKNADLSYDGFFNMIKMHFLPLMPEDNNTVYEGQNTVVNNCTVYSKTGNETVSGRNLQYVEYVSPAECDLKSVTRYYFDSGKLVKCIRIDKGDEMQLDPEYAAIMGQDTVKVGGYAILDIKELSVNVNEILLNLPPKAKIMKYNAPAM